MPTYPAAPFPLPSASFGDSVESPQARTQLEGGRTRQRLRFSSELDKFRITIGLSDAELAIFKAFWRDDLAGGSLFFDLTLPIGAEYEDMSVRFVGGKYTLQYSFYDHWTLNAALERETVQTVPDPVFSPLPAWYRPEIQITEDYEVDPDTERNALFSARPGTGNVLEVTVPVVASVSDEVPIGVLLKSPGSLLIKTEGEDGGGTGPPTLPDWKAQALSMSPSVIFDMADAVYDANLEISELIDSSGLGRDMVDSNLAGVRMKYDPDTKCAKLGGTMGFRGSLNIPEFSSSTAPYNERKFHLVAVFQPPPRQLIFDFDGYTGSLYSYFYTPAPATYRRPSLYFNLYGNMPWYTDHSNGGDMQHGDKPDPDPTYVTWNGYLPGVVPKLKVLHWYTLDTDPISVTNLYNQYLSLDGNAMGAKRNASITQFYSTYRVCFGHANSATPAVRQYNALRAFMLFHPDTTTVSEVETLVAMLKENFNHLDAYSNSVIVPTP